MCRTQYYSGSPSHLGMYCPLLGIFEEVGYTMQGWVLQAEVVVVQLRRYFDNDQEGVMTLKGKFFTNGT